MSTSFYYIEPKRGERLVLAWDGERFEHAGVERGPWAYWPPLPEELRLKYEAQFEDELRSMGGRAA